MKRLRTLFLTTFVASLFAGNAMADPIPFSTSTYLVTGLGDEIGSIYDTFEITGLAGNATLEEPVRIGTFLFSAGYNCNICISESGQTDGFSITINSITQQILFPWVWSTAGGVDTLTVGSPAPLTFGNLYVYGFALGDIHNSVGEVSGDVMALISTPEPGTYRMLMVGLGVLALIVRRHQIVRSKA